MSQRLIRQTVHQNAHNDQQFIHKTTHFLLRDNYKSLMGKFILPYSPALTWQVQCHQPHITYYGDPSPQCIFFLISLYAQWSYFYLLIICIRYDIHNEDR